MTHTATPADLRHGTPVSTRSDRYGLDKHVFSVGPDWPDGLELFIYDDGRVKIGGWHTAVTVEAVRTFASTTGNDSRGGSHVIARFTAAMSAPDAVPELDGADAELRTYLISRARGANLGDPDAAKVTYGGAADAVPAGGWKYPRYTGIGQALDRINRYEHAHGRPLLSVLVVHKEGRQQGPGFTDMARTLGYEIESGGERAFAGAMLREVITYWLTADIDD
jgi:hypothetical protein